MFEYAFYDQLKDDVATPLVEQPIPNSFLKPEDIESLRPTLWREHCVECSEPLCFEVCDRFEARFDGRCRRFRAGMKDNTDPAFKNALHHVEFEYLSWGKLETIIYPRVTTVQNTVDMDVEYKQKQLDLRDKYLSNPSAYDKDRWDREIVPNFDLLYKSAENEVGSQTDLFVLQVYSHNDAQYTLSIEVTTLDTLLMRRSVAVKPGYNEFQIDLNIDTAARGDVDLPENVVLARIVPVNDYPAHMTILMADFVNLKSVQQEKAMPAHPASKVKCVCWDLDNTVWNGTLVESKADDLQLREGVLECMRELDRRGVIQVVVSKNDEDAVRPVISRLGIADMFVYVIANWSTKSSNIKLACKMLNIGLDTFALIDDQPYERAEVSETLPCVRTYAETAIGTLLNEPPFDIAITTESAKRRIMYQEEAKRHDVAAQFAGNNTEFLRSCQMKLRFENIDTEAKILRSFELLRRTNQLNLSGRKYDENHFRAMLDRLGKQCFIAYCEDRFGEYGQILFCAVDSIGTTLYVREFAMSCRTMGKGVESALLAWIVGKARAAGFENVVFRGVKTPRNGLLPKTFSKAGMERAELRAADIALRIATSDSPADAGFIEIVDSTDDWSIDMQPFSQQSSGTFDLCFITPSDDMLANMGAFLANNAASASVVFIGKFDAAEAEYCRQVAWALGIAEGNAQIIHADSLDIIGNLLRVYPDARINACAPAVIRACKLANPNMDDGSLVLFGAETPESRPCVLAYENEAAFLAAYGVRNRRLLQQGEFVKASTLDIDVVSWFESVAATKAEPVEQALANEYKKALLESSRLEAELAGLGGQYQEALNQIDKVHGEIGDLLSSPTYRIGRVLLAVPRMIMRIIKR